MPCPVCDCKIGEADHRACIVQLFRDNRIKSIKEWETLAMKPGTTVKGIVSLLVKKTDFPEDE